MKILSFIKTELFYWRRLASVRFTPHCPNRLLCFWRYFKNRYAGRWLLKRTAGFYFTPNPDFELHALCQKKDLWMLFWALKSFLFFSGLRPKIIIHDDGSIDPQMARMFESKFSGTLVLARADAERRIASLSLSDTMRHYRAKGHPLILKLVDIFLLSRGSKIMVLDSDVLFFKRPEEIVEFVNPSSLIASSLVSALHVNPIDLGVSPEYSAKHSLENKKINFINSGLMVFDRSLLSPELLEDYFQNCLRSPGEYLVEMAGWACILGQKPFKFLPTETYATKGSISDQTIMKHFTSPRRQEAYAYGINLAQKKIKRQSDHE